MVAAVVSVTKSPPEKPARTVRVGCWCAERGCGYRVARMRAGGRTGTRGGGGRMTAGGVA
jgi:hypothetical protein